MQQRSGYEKLYWNEDALLSLKSTGVAAMSTYEKVRDG